MIAAIAVMSVVFLVTATTGCTMFSTMTRATRNVTADFGSDNDLRKTIGMASIGYRTFSEGRSLEALLQDRLIEDMKSLCPNHIIITSEHTAYAELLRSPPRHASGEINNFALSQEGRLLGLNAIVTGAPVDISEEVEERGLLWFKDTVTYARIRLAIDVYDTSTGAKLFGENSIRRIKVDPASIHKIEGKQYQRIDGLVAEMLDAADEISEKICQRVTLQPWKGYVTSVDGNRIVLSAGSDIGLKAGDRLTVYDSGRTIAGIEDQRFYLPGQIIGELNITTVSRNRADAVLVSGKGVAPGSLAVLKN